MEVKEARGTSATVLVTIGSTVGVLSITAMATASKAAQGIHFCIVSRLNGVTYP